MAVKEPDYLYLVDAYYASYAGWYDLFMRPFGWLGDIHAGFDKDGILIGAGCGTG